MTLKVAVIEDSRLAREGLVRMLKEFPELDVVGEADHPSSALVLIQQHQPEVLFLDIHMPGESGFDLLAKLDYSPRIIFTTAYSEYAIKSFDFNTVDYLLKPISHERLAIAVKKLFSSQGEDTKIHQAPLEFTSKIFVKDGDKCHLVSLDSIRYFESCKNYVRIYFNDTNAFIKKSLNSVEERLSKKHFFRVNRQYVVNLHCITMINEGINDGYEITMNDGKLLDISRRNATELKELLSF